MQTMDPNLHAKRACHKLFRFQDKEVKVNGV
jgi:hypothetical protein